MTFMYIILQIIQPIYDSDLTNQFDFGRRAYYVHRAERYGDAESVVDVPVNYLENS